MSFPDYEKVIDIYQPVKIPKPHEFERPKYMLYTFVYREFLNH